MQCVFKRIRGKRDLLSWNSSLWQKKSILDLFFLGWAKRLLRSTKLPWSCGPQTWPTTSTSKTETTLDGRMTCSIGLDCFLSFTLIFDSIGEHDLITHLFSDWFLCNGFKNYYLCTKSWLPYILHSLGLHLVMESWAPNRF